MDDKSPTSTPASPLGREYEVAELARKRFRSRSASGDDQKAGRVASEANNSKFSIEKILGMQSRPTLLPAGFQESAKARKWQKADGDDKGEERACKRARTEDKLLDDEQHKYFADQRSPAKLSPQKLFAEERAKVSPVPGVFSGAVAGADQNAAAVAAAQTALRDDKDRLQSAAGWNFINRNDAMEDHRRFAASVLCSYYGRLTPQWKVWQDLLMRRNTHKLPGSDDVIVAAAAAAAAAAGNGIQGYAAVAAAAGYPRAGGVRDKFTGHSATSSSSSPACFGGYPGPVPTTFESANESARMMEMKNSVAGGFLFYVFNFVWVVFSLCLSWSA